MGKLSKIVIDNKAYKWRYRYDDHDYSQPSYLLILPEYGKKSEIRVYFSLIDKPIEKFILNCGLKAKKDGEDVVINLNQPKFISEIIIFLLSYKVDFSLEKVYKFDNGEQILKSIGYIF